MHPITGELLDDILLHCLCRGNIGVTPATSPFFSLANPRPYRALAKFRSNRSAALKSAIASSHLLNLRKVSPRESNVAAAFGSNRKDSSQSANAPCNSPMIARVQQRSFHTTPDVAEAGSLHRNPSRPRISRLFLVNLATVGKSVGIICIDANCCIKILDGPLILAFFLVSNASIVEWFGVIRIELD